ncbi:IS66 family insertion sequence element accessory protein TnpA [Microbulbifer epialgicus]|uniref:Transposase n=1 Tax=Microbulbifer epialgicus TaxID=393907 RepID=A0ABV4P606_9GAMM
MNQQQWKSHVRAYEKSSQSKRAYTRKHNLNYSQLLYCQCVEDYEALLPWNIQLEKVGMAAAA